MIPTIPPRNKTKKMIKAVIFDFDHTLYNRDASYAKMFAPFKADMAEFINDDLSDAELLARYKGTLEAFIGPTQTLATGNTLQVNNYERYNWTMFNAGEKQQRRETVFPQERKAAFEMGAEMLRE